MKRTITAILIVTLFCSFSKPRGAARIVHKIEQNLKYGWKITHIDNATQFPETMKALHIQYGVTLVNEKTPLPSKSTTVNLPTVKILVSDLDTKTKMIQLVQEKSRSKYFNYFFIPSRKYLLTCMWNNHYDKAAMNKIVSQKDYKIYKKRRKKLFKALIWYFDQY